MRDAPAQRARILRAGTMKIGMAGYAKIIGSLRHGPMSSAQLAEKHKVSRLLITAIMRHCRRTKVVHRASWFRPKPHSRMVPMWALGEGGDISMPMFEEYPKRPQPAAATLITLTTVIEMLREHPHTRQDIADGLCMSYWHVCRIVTYLRSNKLIHVSGWERLSVGNSTAELSAGMGQDKPRPGPRRTTAEMWNSWTKRQAQVTTLRALAGVKEAA